MQSLTIVFPLTCFFSTIAIIIEEKGTWRFGRAPDCLASHACVQGSNLDETCVDFSEKFLCFSLHLNPWARIIILVKIYRRLRIGRDDHFDQCDIS